MTAPNHALTHWTRRCPFYILTRRIDRIATYPKAVNCGWCNDWMRR